MTFPDQLAALRQRATKGPLEVSHDYRPGMSWNNHIVVSDSPFTICFMAHEPKGNDGQEAIAELFVLLANHAEAIEKVVRCATQTLKASDQFVSDTGMKHGDPLTDSADALRDALNELEAG